MSGSDLSYASQRPAKGSKAVAANTALSVGQAWWQNDGWLAARLAARLADGLIVLRARGRPAEWRHCHVNFGRTA
jgi:hypothetical protein